MTDVLAGAVVVASRNDDGRETGRELAEGPGPALVAIVDVPGNKLEEAADGGETAANELHRVGSSVNHPVHCMSIALGKRYGRVG